MIPAKEKIELEYEIQTSPKIIYTHISTPSGLSEWFADDVNINDKTYTFVWNEASQEANLLNSKRNKYIRFQWVDEEDEKSYFEFRINIDEVTEDIALIVTDFVEEDDKEDAINLWDKQIRKLKHILGV